MGKIFHVGHGNHEDPASWSVPHWQANVVAYALDASKAKTGLTREEALFSNAKEGAGNLPKGAAYESADVADNMYPDGRVADEAIKRLQAAKAKPDQPFFIAVGFVKPHLPFCAPKRYWEMYDPESFYLPDRTTPPDGAPAYAPQFGGELRNYKDIPEKGVLPDDLTRTLIHGYHAAMSYMDAQFGRVLDALDQNGLAKNTIVVLWGDHGWHLGDHGMWCKHTNYEQAARIPLLVVAPGVTAPASRTLAMVESVDIYPTLCELAGLTAPAGLDGRSFAATLRDPAAPTKDHILHVYPRNQLLGRAIRTPRYRLVEWKKPGDRDGTAEFELYDYETDPAETKNLAADKAEIVTQLRSLLARHPEAKPQIRGKSGADANSKGKGNSKAKATE
jgi:iduronate 2-sulfatase